MKGEFEFTPEQAQHYYETRLGAPIRRMGQSLVARCPFHDDRHASMSFNFAKGGWYCHTEAAGGGMVDFEMRLHSTSPSDAMAAVKAVAGIAQGSFQFSSSGKPEAIYEYRDEAGRLLFQVVRTRDPRTGKKRISNRRTVGKDGWEYSIEGTRRVLYHLGEVIRASDVFVVEGEKCADAVRAAYCGWRGESDACVADGFTATTNPHGAGKWKEEFAPFFAGKRVVLVPDPDAPGRSHMEMVAASIARYAVGVKWLTLPGASEKDDIADYLKDHEWPEVQALATRAPFWQRPDASGLFVSASEFIRHVPEEVEWRVEGVIEKGTSGFIIALPKSGKSFATVALAASLASGSDWLGCRIPTPTRVALVSREDAPGLTARRLRRAFLGLGLSPDDAMWGERLLVNTRQQSPSLMLDDDAQLAELITAMQAKRIEFCILDVLNVLHDADENDNSEMRRVLARVSQIRTEVGCQVCIVHHSVKEWDDNKTLSQLARGSSAISGFAEFLIGVRMVDETTQARQMKFETKSAEPLASFHWRIRDQVRTEGVVLERVTFTPEEKPRRRAKGQWSVINGGKA